MGLSNRALITMADGSRKTLNKVKVGEYVLGIDAHGELRSQQIIEHTKSPARNDWLRLKGPRTAYSKGSSFWSILATPEQKFFTKSRKLVSSKDIKLCEEIFGIANSLALTRVQKSIMLGILLGDGTLKKAKSIGGSKSLKWTHSEKQLDYLDWSIQALGPICKRTEEHISGYGSKISSARTIFHPDIENALYGFDKPNGIVPEWVAEAMNPIVLAFWYMDDGSLAHHTKQQCRATFSTNSFDSRSHKILLDGLSRNGIKGVLQESAKGPSIRLNADDADMLFCLIAPYIPPSMQYKLPEYYRGNPSWIPKTDSNFREIIVDAKVTEIEQTTNHKSAIGVEHHLKTEFGNVFAHSLLLETSSAILV